jgi:hypothetical protein
MIDHREARELYEYAVERDRTNRTEALEDLRFRAGEQWPDAERKAREAAGRPCLTVNTIGQYIRRVTGEVRQNPPAMKVIPADEGAEQAAQLREGLLRHIEHRSRGKAAYIGALEGAVSCGIGHIRILTELNDVDPLHQDIRIAAVPDPLSVVYDPDAQDITRSDGGYAFVTGRMSDRAFKRRYPKADATEWGRNEAGELSRYWETGDTIRVVEMFRREETKRRVALMSDGTRVDLTGLGKIKARERIERDAAFGVTVLREATYPDFKVFRSVLNGRDFLEEEIEFPSRFIPLVPVVGEELYIGEARVRHGLVRFARDPQRLYNYWRTAAAEMVALAPKAPFMATAAQIGPYKAMWDAANRTPSPYLLYQPDPDAATAMPSRATQIEPPAAMWQEAAVARDDMKAATGIYDASLGAQGNETSGRAIMARQREGDIGSFIYVDNLGTAIEHVGRVLLDMVPRVYDAERVVTILGDDGEARPVLVNVVQSDGSVINDLTVGRYDMKLGTGPSYESKRAETAGAMLQLVEAFPQIMAVGGDILVSNLDFPRADELAERLQAAMQPQQASAPPPDPASEAKALKDFASAAKTQAETQGIALDNLAKRFGLGV